MLQYTPKNVSRLFSLGDIQGQHTNLLGGFSSDSATYSFEERKMTTGNKEFEQELHIEFLKALHEEKTKTQERRATYATSKAAFITGLFGLGSLKISGADFHWLLYLIPLIAIGYDLYLRAEDSSIKKMGAFLRNHPQAKVSETEKAWERFSAEYRDKLAQLANALFSFVAILAATIYAYVQAPTTSGGFWFRFVAVAWFVICLLVNVWLWRSHWGFVRQADEYKFPKQQ